MQPNTCVQTHTDVRMHSHFALQHKFIKYLVTGLWTPSHSLSGAVGHNYKDSCGIKTETSDVFEVRLWGTRTRAKWPLLLREVKLDDTRFSSGLNLPGGGDVCERALA